MRDYIELPRWVQCNHKGPFKVKENRRGGKSQREI